MFQNVSLSVCYIEYSIFRPTVQTELMGFFGSCRGTGDTICHLSGDLDALQAALFLHFISCCLWGFKQYMAIKLHVLAEGRGGGSLGKTM